MPDAPTHDGITVVTGVVLAPLAYLALRQLGVAEEQAPTGTAICVVAHLLSGIMFSPDLDLDSAIDDRWGIFFWIWRPYTWLVPHRHFWSHGLILPPLLRLGYFYLVVVLLLSGGAWLLGQIGIVVPDLHARLNQALLGVAQTYPRESWCFLAGFITGAAAHSAADWLVTGGKRYLRRIGIRITTDYSDHDRWRPRERRRAFD